MYRDDDQAARERMTALREELARELDRLDRHARRRSEIERELADLDRRSARRVALPLLDDIRVAAPCTADWNDMPGTERVRFCRACEKHVYNLSAMTERAAEALLREHEGAACIRLARRADGTIVNQDCPVGRRRVQLRTAFLIGFGVIAAAAAAHAMRPETAQVAEYRGTHAGQIRYVLPWQPAPRPAKTGTAVAPDARVRLGQFHTPMTTSREAMACFAYGQRDCRP